MNESETLETVAITSAVVSSIAAAVKGLTSITTTAEAVELSMSAIGTAEALPAAMVAIETGIIGIAATATAFTAAAIFTVALTAIAVTALAKNEGCCELNHEEVVTILRELVGNLNEPVAK